ncbi:MAG TPA: hypothetical protein VNG13_10335 [Mycobacteriales bacterium]|nr:hypothetical protein [Mycobacteriales bacterium]
MAPVPHRVFVGAVAAALGAFAAGCGTAQAPAGAAADQASLSAPSSSWAPVVPGASSPSPFAMQETNITDYPDVCNIPPRVDPSGRLTSPVSMDGQDVLRPPGQAATSVTGQEVLARFAASSWGAGAGGHPFAVFGLLSAPAPAQILPNGGSRPFYRDRPVWLVVVCDSPNPTPIGGGPGTTAGGPAPGTSPSPGPPPYGVWEVPYDATGSQIQWVSATERPSPAQLAETFVQVPWQRTGDDSDGGRQIGIAYPAAEPCATFDHLAVQETPSTVYLRVWLRLLPDAPTRCPGTASHPAVVGLASPLGNRLLEDADPPPTNPPPAKIPSPTGS